MESGEHAYNTGNAPSCEAANKGLDLVLNIEKRMLGGRWYGFSTIKEEFTDGDYVFMFITNKLKKHTP